MCGKDVGRQGSVTPLSSPCLRVGFWGRQGEGRREEGTSWVLWHPLAPLCSRQTDPATAPSPAPINVTHHLSACAGRERVMGGSPHLCSHHPKLGWGDQEVSWNGGDTHTHTQCPPCIGSVPAPQGSWGSEGPLGSGLGQLLFLTPVSALGRLRAGSAG